MLIPNRPTTEAELRLVVPGPSAGIARKILARLDPHAARMIGLAPFVAISARRADGRVDVGARTGAPGFARVVDDGTLLIPDTAFGRIGVSVRELSDGAPIGLLFVVPGIGDTLRVNGRAHTTDDPALLRASFGASSPTHALRIDVTEQFLHCPKAFVRSRLWQDPAAPPDAPSPESLSYRVRSETLDAPLRTWLARAPFALLATADADGRADVSPRGDVSGFLRVLDERTLLLPDRPGNRLLDSARNLLAQRSIALLALIPGDCSAMRILGDARLTSDRALLEGPTAGDRPAVLGIVIDVREATLEMRHEAFAAARLWDPGARVPRGALPTLGRMLADQIGARGIGGAVVSKAIDASLRRDVRKNL